MSKIYASKALPIIRGRRWPPGENSATVTVIDPNGWPAAAETTWEWRLRFSLQRLGGTPDLILTPDSVTLDTTSLILKFHATSSQTRQLTGGKKYLVDLESTDAGGEPSPWTPVRGAAEVEEPVGKIR